MYRASIIAILLVYLMSFSFQNFVENDYKVIYDGNADKIDDANRDPADFYHFWAGFFNGIGIFKNVTHKKECLSIFPVIHDDICLIHDLIKKIKDFKDMIEALKFIIEKLEHITKKCEQIKPDCEIFAEDVQKVRDQVNKYLEREETRKKIFVHFYKNLEVVIQKWRNVIELLRLKDSLGAGNALGDFINFVVLWDYNPSESNSLFLHILESNHH